MAFRPRLGCTPTILLSLSLASLFELIDLFEKGAGAKLNRSKTEAMWLGTWKFCNDKPHGLTWVRMMKILGIVFGVVDTEQHNWQPKLNKLEKSLNLSKSRFYLFWEKLWLLMS